MLGKNRHAAVILLAILVLSTALVVPEFAFGLGDQPPPVYAGADPFTQKVNAGDTVVYDVWVSAGWFNDWLNVSIGSKFADPINVTMLSMGATKLPQTPSVEPLPEGVEVSYPSKVFIGDTGRSFFPISVKVSPNICQSTIDLAILASGTSKMQNEFYNQPFYGGTTVRLYVEPKNTPLGAASTVFYEGFDRVFVLFKERDTDTPGGWTISRGGTIDLTNDTAMNMFRTDVLQMSKTSSSSTDPVWIEHLFPKINGSFILDFALLTNTTRMSQATNSFTMYLIDSPQNTNIITAGLSNGSINIQSRDYGAYLTDHWYRFRLEADAVNHTFRWYLDDKYVDTLPFTGQPDKIRIAITGNQSAIGHLDDIFLQKITGHSTNTSTTRCASSERTTIRTTLVSTTTITQSTITTTTTATTTLTSTTTSTEQVTDPSTYAWAVSATMAAVILAAVLLLQRRTRYRS